MSRSATLPRSSMLMFHFIILQALHQQQAKDYYILLLITDGILTDMDQTIHMIIGKLLV